MQKKNLKTSMNVSVFSCCNQRTLILDRVNPAPVGRAAIRRIEVFAKKHLLGFGFNDCVNCCPSCGRKRGNVEHKNLEIHDREIVAEDRAIEPWVKDLALLLART